MISQLVSYALGTFVALFPITNPVGAVPIFYSLTANVSKSQRLQQAKFSFWQSRFNCWLMALWSCYKNQD